MSKYKRFFAFGCSFTNYHWPCWPEIISYDLQIPGENWGMAGLGNVGINCRMIECDIKHTFTEDDLIVVLWTSWQREDRYQGRWTLNGNVLNFNNHNKFSTSFDKHFVKKWWHIENDIVKNSTAIISANKMFNIQSQANMTEMFDQYNSDMYVSNPLFNFYEPHLPKTTFPWNPAQKSFDGFLTTDTHPDIALQLKYVKDFVYKDANLTLRQDTITHFTNKHNEIVELGRAGKMKHIKTGNDIADWFKQHDGHSLKYIGFPD